MPEVTDLMRVAQYAKSDRDAPSDVYNAACRLLDGRMPPQAAYDAVYAVIRTFPGSVERNATIWRAVMAYEAARSGAESHRDGRTPQTLGASEGQAASGAQEAPQGRCSIHGDPIPGICDTAEAAR